MPIRHQIKTVVTEVEEACRKPLNHIVKEIESSHGEDQRIDRPERLTRIEQLSPLIPVYETSAWRAFRCRNSEASPASISTSGHGPPEHCAMRSLIYAFANSSL